MTVRKKKSRSSVQHPDFIAKALNGPSVHSEHAVGTALGLSCEERVALGKIASTLTVIPAQAGI